MMFDLVGFVLRSYQQVLPYYIKSERANLRGLHDSPWHGHSGELNVEDIPFRYL